MSADPSDLNKGIAVSEIQSVLERVCQSRPFMRSKQLQRLIRFIVEETRAGRGARLKEYVLGVEVFGRPADFDPRIDSIVRVEARRLRAALHAYYSEEGRSDAVVIDLAKGSYAPTFRRTNPEVSPSAPPKSLTGHWRWIALGTVPVVAFLLYWALWPASLQLPDNPVIAVLPFENLSSDVQNEYLCFGLMDEITSELAKSTRLRVVARTSSSRFKRGDDIARIARTLKADAVLEGSVQKFPDRVLVTAQLINSATSLHIWSEVYDRAGADLLRIQNDIAQAITRAVRRQLGSGGEMRARPVRYSTDPEANQLYWKASYVRAPMGVTNWRNDLLKCAEYLEQATQKDPNFALAYAALADVYVSLAWERGGNQITRDFMSRGKRAATKALELDNTLAEAYGAMGALQFFYEYNPAAAEKSFRRALESDPSHGKARMWFAYALVMQRRNAEAISQALQAKALDPLSYVATTHLAVVYYFSRHYDEALNLVKDTIELANTAPAHGLSGMIFAAQARYADAIAEYQAGLKVVPNHSYIKGMLGHSLGLSGRSDEARKFLADANLPFEQGGLSNLKLSYIYLALGDRDRAFKHLEQDFEQRDPELPYANADPVFDPVRNDPRFIALMRKIGVAR
jgi:TolB-like protein/Flp pilus assembly protein TadD